MRKTEIVNEATAKRRQAKGFTLIELLIVIAILGILGAVAMPKLIGNVDKARSRAVDADIRAYEMAAKSAILNGDRVTSIQDIAIYFKEGIKEGYSLTIDSLGEPVVTYSGGGSGAAGGTTTKIPDLMK